MAAEPYLGDIRAVGFSFAPKNWALCNGQILSINQNQALFSLLGTTYGGNGTTTFALPNLQGRTPMHFGTLPGNSPVVEGQTGGAEAVTLNITQTPSHSHSVAAVSGAGNTNTPANNLPGASTAPAQAYGATPNTPMNSAIVGQTGGNGSHNNIQPSLVLNYIIALAGIFPSRS
jgi:microcystin-dependent protein